jgi:hypothetical protein
MSLQKLKHTMHCFALIIVATLAFSCAANQQLEHITGTQRLGQFFINNHYLALRLNGTVGGTNNSFDVDTILQRIAVNKNHILLRNAVTCMYLCLDRCGVAYASRNLSSDCFLKEVFTKNNYNVMFKIYDHKLTYIGLDRFGKARRVQLPKRRPLRNMSKYTLVLRKPLNYISVTQCSKQKIVIKHRKCY